MPGFQSARIDETTDGPQLAVAFNSLEDAIMFVTGLPSGDISVAPFDINPSTGAVEVKVSLQLGSTTITDILTSLGSGTDSDLATAEAIEEYVASQLVTDHGSLTGLDDPNDHPQYLQLLGGTMLGDLFLRPTTNNPLLAARKDYVDSLIGTGYFATIDFRGQLVSDDWDLLDNGSVVSSNLGSGWAASSTTITVPAGNYMVSANIYQVSAGEAHYQRGVGVHLNGTLEDTLKVLGPVGWKIVDDATQEKLTDSGFNVSGHLHLVGSTQIRIGSYGNFGGGNMTVWAQLAVRAL